MVLICKRRKVLMIGLLQIFAGLDLILLNRLTILYWALLWNILHVALDNPVLLNETKYLYYEEFFP